MRADEAGRAIQEQVDPPWDEVRAARVQKRVMEAIAHPEPVQRRRTWVPLLAAACLAAALVLVVWRPWSSRTRLDLAEGCYAEPAVGAQVVPISVTATRIELEQARGSVSYEVAPSVGRTFVVRAGAVTVQVMGTAFQVNRADGKVDVSVQRGKVRVTRGAQAVVLAEGEHVSLEDTGGAGDAADQRDASAVGDPAGSSEAAEGRVAGDSVDAASSIASAPPAMSVEVPAAPSAAELFRAADDARAAGNADEAIRLLNDLIRLHPKDPRVTMAVFTIGRLQMKKGQPAQAAQSFESCGNAMGGEALAEAALARAAAGDAARAKSLASRYLDSFPNGPRSKEMQRLRGD